VQESWTRVVDMFVVGGEERKRVKRYGNGDEQDVVRAGL
jgi:hypothetical protein